MVHMIGPVLVLAEGTAVARLVAATAGLRGATTTVPTVLDGAGGGDMEWKCHKRCEKKVCSDCNVFLKHLVSLYLS